MHEFHERLQFSDRAEGQAAVLDRVRELLGGGHLERASRDEDRRGTDWWITRPNDGRKLSVDIKARGYCPIERFDSDDACIETCSIYRGPPKPPWEEKHRGMAGWTLNGHSRTDYVVYTWPSGPERVRYWLVEFRLLHAAARQWWKVWAERYGERPAKNKGYLTLNVFPPRRVILDAMERAAVGIIAAAPPLPGIARRAALSREAEAEAVGTEQGLFTF